MDKPIEFDDLVIGQTKVVVFPPHGCCGSTITFYEPTVIDKGKYIGQNGVEKNIVVLDNGMNIEPKDIQYTL